MIMYFLIHTSFGIILKLIDIIFLIEEIIKNAMLLRSKRQYEIEWDANKLYVFN